MRKGKQGKLWKAEDKTEMLLDRADHYTSLGGRMHHIPHRFLKYAMIGVPCFLLDLLVLWILTSNGLFYLYSVMISFIAGHTLNYTLNKLWTFRDSKIPFFSGYCKFILLGIVSIGLTELYMFVFTGALGIHYLYSRVITAVIVSLFNFGMNSWFTFRIHKKQKKG